MTILQRLDEDDTSSGDNTFVLDWERHMAAYLLFNLGRLLEPASSRGSTRIAVLEDGPGRTGLISLSLLSASKYMQIPNLTIVSCSQDQQLLTLLQSSHLFYGGGAPANLELGKLGLTFIVFRGRAFKFTDQLSHQRFICLQYTLILPFIRSPRPIFW